MSYAVVRRNLPWWGVAARYMLSCFLTFATYNPSLYSLTTFVASDIFSPSVRIFIGFALLLSWVVILRISFAGLDRMAWFAVFCFILSLCLLEIEFHIFRGLDSFSAILLLELLIAAVLAFGLVQSYWVRRLAGQSPVVKFPP